MIDDSEFRRRSVGQPEVPWYENAMESMVSSCSASVFSASEDVPSPAKRTNDLINPLL